MGLWAMLKGEEPGIIDTLLHYENPGQFGEYATEFALSNDNLEGYSKTVHNVYLPHKGKTTEPDVLLIHEKGVFAFESKNYSGWIFGSAEQQKWTQSLKNGEKNQFYNPLKQNTAHCEALREFLDFPVEWIHSYIVFSQRCELKKVPPDTEQYTIVQRQHLLKKLRKDLSWRVPLLTPKMVDQITEKLQNAANVTDEQKAQHVANIKEQTSGTICPFCGGQLILRKGKYGFFYGCSAYPKCKFTRKIS